MTDVTFPPPLSVDRETKEMMHAYALADHTLHCGESGTFHFYRWGRRRELIVVNGEMRVRILPRAARTD